MKFKRIIAAALAATCVFSLASCNKKEESPQLELIDFENGVLNIDNSEIENYVKKSGYENITFVFDVDKQIYSCEIALSKEESKKIVIDGEGYESFISKTRQFLINGTKVMKQVMEGYGLSGISAGMLLTSNDDVVYCVAVDGSVTYVAHTRSETASLEDVKEAIAERASLHLSGELSVTINPTESTILVYYESSEDQETVENAFSEVKSYLNAIGFGNYELNVGGRDDQPFVFDEPEPVEDVPFEVPETLPYNHVGFLNQGSIPVFEIIATEENHESVADLAIVALNKDLDVELCYFYVIDENGRFLGTGSKDEYTPYVYSDNDFGGGRPSYVTPFMYYLSKHFNGIKYLNFEYVSYRKTEHSSKTCEFVIRFDSYEQHKEVEEVLPKLLDDMHAAIGHEGAIFTITAYPGTDYEIKLEEKDPVESNGESSAEAE